MALSRRELMAGAAALAASTVMSRLTQADVGPIKPNSRFNGVQIGAITYSFRSMPSSAEDILRYCLKCSLSSVELMGDPAEQFARKAAPSGSMDGFKALRKMYNDAGVNIYIVKFEKIGDPAMSDDQIEYCFNAAKALGAKGITRELSVDAAKRLGPLADKHEIVIGFHNHTQIKPDTYDGSILSYGKYLGINFDVGHYLAGTGESPIPFIERHHDRILSLHLKDRKTNNGPNMPWGQGDTPVGPILQLLKRKKWTFPADIELEYKVPQGSDAVAEVAKCVEFCRLALA